MYLWIRFEESCVVLYLIGKTQSLYLVSYYCHLMQSINGGSLVTMNHNTIKEDSVWIHAHHLPPTIPWAGLMEVLNGKYQH